MIIFFSMELTFYYHLYHRKKKVTNKYQLLNQIIFDKNFIGKNNRILQSRGSYNRPSIKYVYSFLRTCILYMQRKLFTIRVILPAGRLPYDFINSLVIAFSDDQLFLSNWISFSHSCTWRSAMQIIVSQNEKTRTRL